MKVAARIRASLPGFNLVGMERRFNVFLEPTIYGGGLRHSLVSAMLDGRKSI
jgi:hypothetical protein